MTAETRRRRDGDEDEDERRTRQDSATNRQVPNGSKPPGHRVKPVLRQPCVNRNPIAWSCARGLGDSGPQGKKVATNDTRINDSKRKSIKIVDIA